MQERTRTFARLKRDLLLACGAVGLGVAVAGTVSQCVGGAILLVSATAAIVAVHRLGRSGPDLPSDGSSAASGVATKHDDADVGPETR